MNFVKYKFLCDNTNYPGIIQSFKNTKVVRFDYLAYYLNNVLDPVLM